MAKKNSEEADRFTEWFADEIKKQHNKDLTEDEKELVAAALAAFIELCTEY